MMSTHPQEWVRYESVASLNPLLEGSLLIVDPQAWFAARTLLTANPRSLARAESLDADVLDALLRTPEALDGVSRVIGLGGGTAIDTAKYLAYRTGLPLILVPSVLSVDAPFTDTAAVRREGRIHYTGHIVPEAVVVDAALIRTAPVSLNRGGVGDILSIHTALYDWRLAHQRTGEPYDAAIAQQSASLLKRLRAQSGEIYAVSDAGIRLLTELFCEEVYLCLQVGSSRPEEGSEHHLLYTLEYLSGRTYLHGAAVTLCALLMAYLQSNAPDSLRDLADACGVEYQAILAGAGETALLQALLRAPDYAREENLPYTVLMELPLTESRAREALAWLQR